jgi:type II secretory pathway component PulJ
MMRRSWRKLRGFTLVEVLIAATILFTAITVISDSYRASMAASRRADSLVRLMTPMPLIVETVAEQLRLNPQVALSGEGRLLGVRYEFSATTSAFEPPLPRLEAEVGEVTEFQPRFRLYDVELRLRNQESTRVFRYQEIAWLAGIA